MHKRLIVNADDFGFTRDVNAGIIEGHRNGILTATTLMANGDAFDDAVALARQTPSLDIGCHLVFVQGQSVSSPQKSLPKDLKNLLFAGNLNYYEEAKAQLTKILAAGLQPTHLDTHKHTHLFPPILNAVAKIAREFNIPWVRHPFDYATGSRWLTAAGMRLMRPHLTNQLKGLLKTDHFTGFHLTGELTEGTLTAALNTLPEGLTEFMCHPGHLGAELQNANTRLKHSRAIELTALTSPAAREAISRNRIQLTNYLGEIRLLSP